MPLFGTATLSWTEGGAQSHTLQVPIQEVRPSYRARRYVRESLDYSNREVYTIGSGVYEILGVIRYDNDPQSLIDMLSAGARGLTLTYDDGTNSYACYLVYDSDEITPDFDVDQKAFDELKMEVRLRKTDGTAFPSSVFTG